ncbi:hypothetical protein MJH12_00490 [bacterium]|nr:hypothetical protein [bacterium]
MKRLLFVTLLLSLQSVFAIPMYSQREGLDCRYCHTKKDTRSLNHEGYIYRRNGHFFPYQQKPKISQQFKDSKTDPRFLKLKERYLKKYFKRDPINEYIETGKRIFFGSYKIEKKSSKNCSSCHTPQEIMGAAKQFPRYIPLAEKVLSLEQMQNYCIKNHLGGKPLNLGQRESLSIAAYLNNISK